MRRLSFCILIISLILAGCVGPALAPVSLASPADGSTVNSVRPTLSWGGGAAHSTYRLSIASDSNFQNPVVDATNLIEIAYTVPSGKLHDNALYYWRVMAQKGDQLSSWSVTRSFRTQGISPSKTGNVLVNATLDGAPWSGSASIQLSGPFTDTESTLPWSFNNIPGGNYTITYNYGGPANSSLVSIGPSPNQQLTPDGMITFSLNFQTPVSSMINVSATLDGVPWTGNINYSISGPLRDADTVVPFTFSSMPTGTYTLIYTSGGPKNAIFNSISPSASQLLPANGVINYVLNFTSAGTSNLSVTAFYNGASWSGPVKYSLSGPVSGTYSSTPLYLTNVPSGTYRITYQSGGPTGATMGGVIPDSTIVISAGRSGEFSFNYYAQSQSGNVLVKATLNGSPWSGPVNYSISGAFEGSDQQVPRTYNSVPVGNYSISYLGGGPSGALLSSITPTPAQKLSSGSTIVFTLNFTTQPSTGNINIYATIDGKSWKTNPGSGPISYSVVGPNLADTEDIIPGRMVSLPAGSYTLVFNSGGPIGSTLTGISPAPTLNLPAGGTISFTMNFTSEARGYVTVDATLDGAPWSGSANYVVQGPYVQSGSSVSQTFSGAPSGMYTVQFSEGGPELSFFSGVSPASQELISGGFITFTLNFTSLPGPMPGPVPNPTPDPGPMPGPVPNPNPDDPPMPGPVPNPTPYDPPGPVPNPTPDEPIPGPVPNPTPDEPIPGPLIDDLSP
jgi:hypothetical protein